MNISQEQIQFLVDLQQKGLIQISKEFEKKINRKLGKIKIKENATKEMKRLAKNLHENCLKELEE